MRYQLNLIDARLLPTLAVPSVATLLVLAALAGLGTSAHLAWERAQLARTMALPGAVEAASGVDEDAPDPAYAERLLRVERDEALRDALVAIADLPVDSAARLRDMAAALPDALWLTEIELSGRGGVRIAGGALDTAALVDYTARLGRVAGLQGLPLRAVTVEPRRRALVESEPAAEGRALPPPHHRFVLASGESPAADGSTR